MDRFVPVSERLRFADEKMQKVNLAETDSLFCDVYCLEAGQAQKAHTHAVGDKLYYVLAGRCLARVGEEEREVGPGTLVCAPAGDEHGVRNPGPERLTLLVMMAPKPA